MENNRVHIIKQLYFTIVTVVVFAMMIISAGYLINTGFYMFVFTGDSVEKPYPPSPYLLDPTQDSVDCSDDCDLSTSQIQQAKDWLAEYKVWQTTEIKRYDRDGLVTALSFFIIAVPLYIIHFRLFKKAHKKAESENRETTIFYVFYYIVALGTLVAGVVYAALIINTTLRTWIITDDANLDTTEAREMFVKDPSVSTLASCATACGLTEEEMTLLEEYQDDVRDRESYYQDYTKSWQRRFSSNIAGILVTLPFFVYHWMIIQRKPKRKEE